jgi:hypothetical protein
MATPLAPTRPAVTTATRCSRYVQDAAVRLFVRGYLGRLRFDCREDDHLYYTLPSESEQGRTYRIDYGTAEGTLRCSCQAGMVNVPCKHVRLFQLYHGWAIEEAGA